MPSPLMQYSEGVSGLARTEPITMITDTYAQAFYRAIYSRLSLCEQDNVRYVYGDWLERFADTAAFCEEMQRACGWLKPVLAFRCILH